METILCPTDFSESSENAIHYAAALASQTGSKLILMHAILPDVIEFPGNPFERKVDNRLENYYLDKLQYLSQQIRLQTGSKVEVETICVPGPFPDSLNDLVRSKEVDLVVMGTKGAHNLLEKIFGTNTASFIKQALCPVLAIPANVQFHQINNIAYASDFERQDTVFLKQLLAFAEPLGAAITIFNIKTDEQLDLVSDWQILRGIEKHFRDKNFSFAQLKENSVVAGIEAFVEENKMDLLAVSVYQPDMLEKIFHTGVSQQLAYHSRIPLLALPLKPYSASKTARQRKSLRAH
jgi:nucleotide-binding universal stress UspA family protein